MKNKGLGHDAEKHGLILRRNAAVRTRRFMPRTVHERMVSLEVYYVRSGPSMLSTVSRSLEPNSRCLTWPATMCFRSVFLFGILSDTDARRNARGARYWTFPPSCTPRSAVTIVDPRRGYTIIFAVRMIETRLIE